MNMAARATQPLRQARMLLASMFLAVACHAASAQTFIITSANGARFSSTPIAGDARFDAEPAAGVNRFGVDRSAASASTGPTLSTATGLRRGADRSNDTGASMPESVTASGTLPRASSLDLTLDVSRFVPAGELAGTLPDAPSGIASSAADSSPPAIAGNADAPAAGVAGASAAALLDGAVQPAQRRTLVARDDADDLAVNFNVKGFSLFRMDGDAETELSFRRVRERELRRPFLSLTLQKKF